MTKYLKTTGNEEFFLVQLQDFLDGDSSKVNDFEKVSWNNKLVQPANNLHLCFKLHQMPLVLKYYSSVIRLYISIVHCKPGEELLYILSQF